MKKTMFAFCMFLLLACTAMFADGGPKPVLCPPKQQCPAVVSPAPVKPVVVVADGSDPMPLCRPTQNKQCPQVVAPVQVAVASFDGGPIPLCEPCPVKNCVPRRCPLFAPAYQLPNLLVDNGS